MIARSRVWIITTLIIVSLVAIPYAWAATSSGTAAPAKGAKNTPGVELAQTLSTVTGIAISPLLGVSAVGCWQYLHAPSGQRGTLPWYAQPWFWLPGLIVVGLLAAKDVAGTALPPGLKKPVDIAETVENKVSGLIATGALIPLIGTIVAATHSPSASLLQGTPFAFIDTGVLMQIAVTPFALACYAMVWLASHAIHVLILLSPWGVVDAALKSARTFILASLAGVAYWNPWYGAMMSGVLIVIAYFIAGWSFRLTCCGSIYCWDFFTFRRTRFAPNGTSQWCFAACELGKIPIRTYGRLVKSSEGFEFTYRPWLVLPAQTERLTTGSFFIGRGLLHPSFHREEKGSRQTLFNFPPRYRTHEESLGSFYQVPVHEVGILSGIKELFGFKSKPAQASGS